ncbi:chaperone NapD [Rhodobacteraceae bacterium F11138]|nr:chaperone NapD [Rhodobacteraceae bacterium F11138]
MNPAQIHISSLLVRCDPCHTDRVSQMIGTIDIAEVALNDSSGKLVVLLETDSDAAIADVLTRIQLLDGVTSAAMVYHQACDAHDLPIPKGAII